jgi:hypothetical protein
MGVNCAMAAFKCLKCGKLAEGEVIIRPSDTEQTCSKCGRLAVRSFKRVPILTICPAVKVKVTWLETTKRVEKP